MDAVEAANEATPPLKDEEMTDNADVIVLGDSDESFVETVNEATLPLNEEEKPDKTDLIVLDDSDDSVIVPEESSEEPMPGATEAARDAVDAVIDHTGPPGTVEAATVEIAGGEQTEQAEMDDVSPSNSGDTLPMYEETSTGEEAPSTADVVANGDVEMKDESPSTEGEISLPLPETNDAVEEELSNEPAGNLPAIFPHCYICGFDRQTVFMKEKKATSGQYKNKLIYRNRCVRKACIRYFGPTYMWNGKAGEYVKIGEESSACSRPFADAPRAAKFPTIDYERAGQGGVCAPIENNGMWARAAATAAVDPLSGTASTSTSDSPTLGVPKPSTSRAFTSKASAGAPKAPSAAKKPRKGYQWVEEDEEQPQPRLDPVMELARMYAAQNAAVATTVKAAVSRRTTGSQTGDEDHVVQTLVEEMKAKATFRGLQPSDEIPMSATISNRLFLTQKLLRSQTAEIKSLRKERDTFRENMKKINELMVEYKKLFVADMTRLKEDVAVANKELKHYSLEAQNEAQKDIRDINKIKNDVAKRLDDVDRYRRKVEASLEYQKSVTGEAEELSNNYHRLSVELEKKIMVAKMEEEDAKEKLNDKIYLKNNEKCTHCQVNERLQNRLTDQITEKMAALKNHAKEREDLVRRLENSERIAKIMNKENQQLKFEKSAWETNCHRFRSELNQLKGNSSGLVLPSSLTSSSSSIPPGEAAFTPQSTTTKESDEVSPERIGDDAIEIDRPPLVSSTSSAEEGELKSPRSMSPTSLARLPPPPPPPPAIQLKAASPDHAAEFANWIPKEKKVQEVPAGMEEAMRKVAESLERGPPPKKEEKPPQPPPHKKEKRDEKAPGGKRSGGPTHPPHPHHKNGEKKLKLDGAARKEAKGAPPRPIPSLGTTSKAATPLVMQKVAEKEKRERREERIRESSPIPYSSTHEPAYPAVVTKKSVKMVPYNGPSTHFTGGSTPSSSTSSPLPTKHHKATPEKKKLSFLPVAGSLALPPLAPNPRDPPPHGVPVDRLLQQAEKLREIERERELRARAHHHADIRGPDPFFDHVAASAAAADRRMEMRPLMPERGPPRFSDEELPWNQGRSAPPQPSRPRTPVQDWYYDAPSGHAGPPQPRSRSPSNRYYDDMYDPRAPRDQYGRLEPDFGVLRHPHQLHGAPLPHPHPHPPHHPPHHGAPPPHAPPPADVWRREWHGTNWSNEEPRQRERGYWD